MTSHAPIDEIEDKPLDPAVERVRKRMMRLMLVSIGIMLVGLMAVLFGIVYKLSSNNVPPPTAGSAFDSLIVLPTGGRVVSQTIEGDQLGLLFEDAAGRQGIILIDTVSGRETGRITLSAP